MTFDLARQRAVLFGGWSGTSKLSHTWEYDGTSWFPMTPVDSPRGRQNHALSYDPLRQRTVLLGGYLGGGPTGYVYDTWEYDGTTWVEIASVQSPPARGSYGMAYFDALDRLVLFGGYPGGGPGLNDTWERAGTDWSEVKTLEVSPPGRRSSAVAYDRLRRRLVLFGGQDSGVTYRDTWFYQYRSTWPDEVCGNGLDDDADGLTDCEDPDCDGLPCSGGICTAGVCQ
jgi:hypothetical protein